MSTRSTVRLFGVFICVKIPFTADFYIHVYRDYGRLYIEFGQSYSDMTFELPRFWRRRQF